MKRSRHALSAAGEGTVGALDMGGASTQITFYPGLSRPMPENFTGNAVLYEKNYTVYTHSFLCYGINEITRKYEALLVKVRYRLFIFDLRFNIFFMIFNPQHCLISLKYSEIVCPYHRLIFVYGKFELILKSLYFKMDYSM